MNKLEFMKCWEEKGNKGIEEMGKHISPVAKELLKNKEKFELCTEIKLAAIDDTDYNIHRIDIGSVIQYSEPDGKSCVIYADIPQFKDFAFISSSVVFDKTMFEENNMDAFLSRVFNNDVFSTDDKVFIAIPVVGSFFMTEYLDVADIIMKFRYDETERKIKGSALIIPLHNKFDNLDSGI